MRPPATQACTEPPGTFVHPRPRRQRMKFRTRPTPGPLVKPGTYSVSLGRLIDTNLTPLGGPQTIEVMPLERALPWWKSTVLSGPPGDSAPQRQRRGTGMSDRGLVPGLSEHVVENGGSRRPGGLAAAGRRGRGSTTRTLSHAPLGSVNTMRRGGSQAPEARHRRHRIQCSATRWPGPAVF